MQPFNRHKFGEFLAQQLDEKLSFDRLFQYSEPKRVARSHTVRGPSLQVDALKNGFAWYFNAKSYPSTTGLRQKCYIRFFKPTNPNISLEGVDCEIDCTCPDYRYRFAWSNKQRGSGSVGPNSLNKSLNRAPIVTNPGNVPGMCKHLLALRDFIYGKYATWDWGGMDMPSRLDKLVRYADKRLIRGETLPDQQANLTRRKEQAGQPRPPAMATAVAQPQATPNQPPANASRRLGPNLGGAQSPHLDSVVRAMDAQPILDDLKLVEAEVKDEELLKKLREFFSIWKELVDEVGVEPKDDDAAKLELPTKAKKIDPLTGKSEDDEGNAGKEGLDGDGKENEDAKRGLAVAAD